MGWWEFSCNVELSDCELEHIAELIKQGYECGQVTGEGQGGEDDCTDEEE